MTSSHARSATTTTRARATARVNETVFEREEPKEKKKRCSERSAFTISSVEKKKTVCPPSREVLLREKKK